MLEPLLQVTDLKVHFGVGKSLFNLGFTVKAVDGVSFPVSRGEIVGLVGESGSGKTTLGRAVLRLIEPTDGQVIFDGQAMRAMRAPALRSQRSRMQIIFQDPYASLNPRMSVGQTLSEALYLHSIGTARDGERRVGDLLDRVGLPRHAATRFPHEFSGGQRQRIDIARALAVNPQFIVADEPVSALDVSIEAQIINLLQDLRQDLGLSILCIGHDLSVIEFLCDRVVVLYLSKITETATAEALYTRPRHPYPVAIKSGWRRSLTFTTPTPRKSPLTSPPPTRRWMGPAMRRAATGCAPRTATVCPIRWSCRPDGPMTSWCSRSSLPS